jgi:Cu(I)/Ag(I) efflux system membrane fusion protein
MHPEIVKDAPGSCDVCGMDLVRAEELGYSTKSPSDTKAPLVIPVTAPMITGKRAIVYVEIPNDEGPLFEGREIALGPRAGDFYVVKSGLEEGELVVTNGAFKIDSELQIQAKPSMMSPDGGGAPMVHKHGQTSEGNVTKEEKSITKTEISKDAMHSLTPVYDAYFSVQMALADDNLDDANNNYGALLKQTKAVDMSLFKGEAHMVWMELSDIITNNSEKGKDADDFDASRSSFLEVSKALVKLQETFGHSDNKDYFLTFCPMANNNKGAHWLQTVDTVYNSFYGDMMLRCGEIQKTLSSNSGDEE